MALALARVALHAPRWAVLDDTFSSMEDETLRRVLLLFSQRGARTTIVHIGRGTQTHLPLFKKVLHFSAHPAERKPNGTKPSAVAAAAQVPAAGLKGA
jgi:putative ATP-binding cassette transporter